jgi:hypothetical protein
MSKRDKKTKKKDKESKKTAKRGAKAFKKAAVTSLGKFKTAAEFVYKHRDKIKEAAELVAAVLGTASQILVKPGRSRGRKRKSKQRLNS